MTAPLTAETNGILAAAENGDTTTDTAYISTSGTSESVVTYHFNGYVYDGITMSGSLSKSAGFLNGTLTFTGSTDVTQIVYNNIGNNAGSYTITFANSVVYTWDLSSDSFTISG